MREDSLRRRIGELGAWFHNFELEGVHTAPDHFLGDYPRCFWKHFAHAIPEDLEGRTVLDIGCNAGFFSMEMARRGADRVLGIDSDPRYLAQGRLAAEVLGMDVEFRQLSVYELSALGERFDLVLFMGVIYHLRHPLLALDIIHQHAARDLLVFQSMLRGGDGAAAARDDYPFSEKEVFDQPGFPKLHFIEDRYTGDPTNWWIPNRACAEAMLRDAGFSILAHPDAEIFVCRREEGRGHATPGFPIS